MVYFLKQLFVNKITVVMIKSKFNTRSSAVAERPSDASCHWIFR